MIVEVPTITDLPGLVVESKAMFDQMGFDQYGSGWELEKMRQWWYDVITKDNYEIVIARDNGRIVGVSVAQYHKFHPWHNGPMRAIESAHHAAPDLSTTARSRIMIKMLDEMMARVTAKGAAYYFIGYDPKPQFKGWGDHLRKKGFIDSAHLLVIKTEVNHGRS